MNRIKVLYTNGINAICCLNHWDPLSYWFKAVDNQSEFYDRFKDVECVNFEDALNYICNEMNWKFLGITMGKDKEEFDCYHLFFEELPKEKISYLN